MLKKDNLEVCRCLSPCSDAQVSYCHNAAPIIQCHSEWKIVNGLRELLKKYNVPEGISVRLIHKHFDTTEGEVMVFDKISVPGHGVVQIMKPVVPRHSNQLRGIQFFVNENAFFQAYEYGNHDLPDMSGLDSFLAEFCNIISERDLQRKFGLSLPCEDDTDQNGWTEYEFHAKRGTIMFPNGMPMPDGPTNYSVNTEWKAVLNELPRTCKHLTTCRHGRTTCRHCRHCNSHPDESDVNSDKEIGFCLGRQKILPGTPVYDIIDSVIAAF